MDDRTPADPPEPLAPRRSLRSLELRAALLLVFMAALLTGAALYLMWARGAFEATQPLYLTTDDSEGVVVGMDMTFSGFPIGRVRRIELATGGTVRIHVDVPVKDAHWLRSSSVFTLEKGLVGAARLRAFTGVLDDPPLPTDAERMVLRGDVSAEIPKMVADARDVLQNVDRLTAAESALSETLGELRAFTGRLNSSQGGLMAAVTGNDQDARRVGELLERASQLVKTLDGVVQKADRQVLGDKGLVTDAQATVRQLNALLQDVRQSMLRVDAVLKDAQGVAGNAREATADLGDLRADVEGSLRKIDALVTEINRKWPFAPKEKEVRLP
ncbi:MlaD family protein [Ottowia sp.]|jgi:phospholipid/cholesterol/gamma-HCH transport system substrate-binding protein|uniref:MlaD family protein n=1 Tax=Ottowia sp. TaxID=1898956 RepID=UPI0025F50A5F|nr:MlaD family protein [Ottowia sp.]MBK6613060.1 MCE family protein [Ottowia sp.]MBK6747829.1 MCE family protein [Ottowia sp.]